MGDTTHIEWTDATWNPVTGCTRVSPGCENCYIDWAPPFRIEGRHFTDRDGMRSNAIGSTTGVRLHPDRLDWPLRKRSWRGKRVFVCSLADLFHDDVPDEFIAKVFAVMALAPEVTFQVLTKRPARMRVLLSSDEFRRSIRKLAASCNRPDGLTPGRCSCGHSNGSHNELSYCQNDNCSCGSEWRIPGHVYPWQVWPLPNVWLGVTVEDQQRADQRIPLLLLTPAAVRWLSCEPLLGRTWLPGLLPSDSEALSPLGSSRRPTIDWVVAGGESGPGARPMHPDWARSLRHQCEAAAVPFLFKQWGEWAPDEWFDADGNRHVGRKPDARDPKSLVMHPAGMTALTPDNPFDPWGRGHPHWHTVMRRVGKRAAGRLLDGIQHDGHPDGGA